MSTNLEKKQLRMTRSLIQGNMPRAIVPTKRQPFPDSMKQAARKIASLVGDDDDDTEVPIVVKAAKAFMDAEDDISAAAAMALLYISAKEESGEEYTRIVHEIDSFKRECRSVYLAELRDQTDDDSYNDLIEEKIFRERAFKSGDPNAKLIVRYLASIDSLMQDEVIRSSDEDEGKKLVDTGQWFDLTYKKLIDRCGDYLNTDLSGDDRHICEFIMKRSQTERELVRKVITEYSDRVDRLRGLTWSEAIEMIR